MKKTTFLPILGLMLAGAALLTAFSVKNVFLNDPEVTFEEFLQQFPQQKLPYALDENSIKVRLDQYVAQVNNPEANPGIPQTHRLDWKYYDFLPDLENEARFSRLPMQAEPVALFAVADRYAVLYSTSRSYRFGFATYHISVFDQKGHQISSNMVGKVMPESIVSATISADLQAELKTWRIDWKKSYEKNGIDGNKITGLTYVETTRVDLMKPTPSEKKRLRHEELVPQIEENTDATEGAKSK